MLHTFFFMLSMTSHLENYTLIETIVIELGIDCYAPNRPIQPEKCSNFQTKGIKRVIHKDGFFSRVTETSQSELTERCK